MPITQEQAKEILANQREIKAFMNKVESSNAVLSPEKAQRLINDVEMLDKEVKLVASSFTRMEAMEKKVSDHVEKVEDTLWGSNGLVTKLEVFIETLGNLKGSFQFWAKTFATLLCGVLLGVITVVFQLVEKRLETPPPTTITYPYNTYPNMENKQPIIDDRRKKDDAKESH